ncbi:MAG: universal stress protein, partial [Waterburya sp.]
PLANPDNIPALLEIAGAIAKYHQYEIECLRVICIPNYIYPAQAQVETADTRQLMESLENWGKQSAIPIHTQIRVATDIGEAILETITREHINLLLMGWKGQTSGIESIFGSVVDSLIKQAGCDLMLVKVGKSPHAFPPQLKLTNHQWLIPTTGGDRINKLLTILPALAKVYSTPPQLKLCQIYAPGNSPYTADLQQAIDFLKSEINLPINSLLIPGNSVSDTVIDLTQKQRYDLVILGASNEGLLQTVVQGNIPEAIARYANSTVLIFRSSEQ